MAFRCNVFIVFTLLILASGANSEVPEPSLLKGKQYIYSFSLDTAISTFDSLLKIYPEDPVLYFYRGYARLIMYSQAMTNEKLLEQMETDFYNVMDKIEGKPEKTARDYFYLAFSYGALGASAAVDKSYYQAFLKGRKAKNYLEKVVELDSTYFDAYFGLGIYHYYVGLLPGIFRFFAGILGFTGDRELGLRELGIAAEKGKHFQIEAQFVKASILYFMENEPQAIHQIRLLGNRYPLNPVVPMLLGYHFRRNGMPDQAIPYFLQVQDYFGETLPQIYQMKYYNLAVAYFLKNDFEQAESILKEKLEPEFPRMTMYYQSAYRYYLGLIFLIKGKPDEGYRLLAEIPDRNHTSFWYLSSRLFLKNPIPDRIFAEIMSYRNEIFCHNTNNLQREERIEAYYRNHDKDVWYYYYLDSKGLRYYLSHDYERAHRLYYELRAKIRYFEGTNYVTGWILLHHARVLIKLRQYEQAENLIREVKKIDDDYIRFIAEREYGILIREKDNGERTI